MTSTLALFLEQYMRISILCFLVTAFMGSRAEAAQVMFFTNRISETCASIRINGDIRSGDTKALAVLIAKNNKGCKGQNIDPTVSFDSPGGDVDEALRMGRFIRSNNLSTSVEHEAVCASACNIAFIGGVSRSVDGRFGIHRPYALELRAAESDALKAYDAIAQTLKVYAVEMRVSPEIVERMMKISPQDVAYLSRQEMASLGVTGIYPVWEDVLISREAKALGISRQEFIQRQAATKTLCGTGLRPFPDTCSDSVMRTGRPSR